MRWCPEPVLLLDALVPRKSVCGLPWFGAFCAAEPLLLSMAGPLPVKCWGLDPMYWSHVKLLVRDIHALGTFPGIADSHMLGGHPLSRVEVVGTVVSVERKARFTRYRLDDGTGLIALIRWINPDTPIAAAASFSSSSAAMRGEEAERLTCVSHGDLVRVHGRIKLHDGWDDEPQREVVISRMSVLRDPLDECTHWLEAAHLSRRYYSKASAHRPEHMRHLLLPSTATGAVDGDGGGDGGDLLDDWHSGGGGGVDMDVETAGGWGSMGNAEPKRGGGGGAVQRRQRQRTTTTGNAGHGASSTATQRSSAVTAASPDHTFQRVLTHWVLGPEEAAALDKAEGTGASGSVAVAAAALKAAMSTVAAVTATAVVAPAKVVPAGAGGGGGHSTSSTSTSTSAGSSSSTSSRDEDKGGSGSGGGGLEGDSVLPMPSGSTYASSQRPLKVFRFDTLCADPVLVAVARDLFSHHAYPPR